jgi:hypothetical protein
MVENRAPLHDEENFGGFDIAAELRTDSASPSVTERLGVSES